MSCQNHPNKESVANCQFCGKKLCEDCAISIAGKNYCEECMSDLVGPELANIARKTQSSETQETTAPNQISSRGEQNYVDEAQAPIHEEMIDTIPKQAPDVEQTQTPEIENEEAVVKQNEQGIPSQGHENINNMDDTEYDDIYSDNRLYDDTHINEAPLTPQSNEKIEEKYEKYLDDLYFDENPETQVNTSAARNENLSLSEQLAQDESIHGQITQEPFVPKEPVVPEEFSSEVDINENNEKEREHTLSSMYGGSIHYKKKEKKPYSSTEKILVLILIILIILVSLYLIYLLTLHDQYPNVLDAITAFFGNPGEVLKQIFS